MLRHSLCWIVCAQLGFVLDASAIPAPSAVQDPIEAGRALAQEIIAQGAPGISVAVARDGTIVWSEGFGWADAGLRIPMTPTTRIRVGSTAKSMTAVGLALLVEGGKIDLDAAIQETVPSFPVKPEGVITPRLLGGNLSGIPHYQGFEFMSNRPFATVLDGLVMFQDKPLVCAPGERFAYSTYGWSLLSAAMETASGKDFLSYMDERVFRPLTMNGTGGDYADRTLAGRATCYDRIADELVVSRPVDNSYKWAGGGFLSNAHDLVLLGSAVLEPGFLTQESLDLLFTSQRTQKGDATGYGVGWFVGEEQGETLYTHGGGSAGGTTFLLVHPASKVVVALATNLSRGPVGRTRALELWRLFVPKVAEVDGK